VSRACRSRPYRISKTSRELSRYWTARSQARSSRSSSSLQTFAGWKSERTPRSAGTASGRSSARDSSVTATAMTARAGGVVEQNWLMGLPSRPRIVGLPRAGKRKPSPSQHWRDLAASGVPVSGLPEAAPPVVLARQPVPGFPSTGCRTSGLGYASSSPLAHAPIKRIHSPAASWRNMA
jgi:hypothetical protein